MCYNGFTTKVNLLRDSKIEGVATKLLLVSSHLKWVSVKRGSTVFYYASFTMIIIIVH